MNVLYTYVYFLTCGVVVVVFALPHPALGEIHYHPPPPTTTPVLSSRIVGDYLQKMRVHHHHQLPFVWTNAKNTRPSDPPTPSTSGCVTDKPSTASPPLPSASQVATWYRVRLHLLLIACKNHDFVPHRASLFPYPVSVASYCFIAMCMLYVYNPGRIQKGFSKRMTFRIVKYIYIFLESEILALNSHSWVTDIELLQWCVY